MEYTVSESKRVAMEIYRNETTAIRKVPLHPIMKIGLAAVILFPVILFLYQKKPVLSPIAALPSQPTATGTPPTKPNVTELSKAVAGAFDDSILEYSLVIDDFRSNMHFELGDQTTYIGASILKLPILIRLYEKIADLSVKPDQTVPISSDDIQDYGTGSLRYNKPGATLSISELATLMMKQSDNTAAYVLGRKVLQFDDIQKSVTRWGLTETNMEDNTTSNKDLNILFRKLFSGALLPSGETREVIGLLADSDFEDRLPLLLPREAKIYHKVGSTVGGIHDVGVIMGNHSLYYIGILTRGVTEDDRAAKAIARISKAVYDVMEQTH